MALWYGLEFHLTNSTPGSKILYCCILTGILPIKSLKSKLIENQIEYTVVFINRAFIVNLLKPKVPHT